MTGQSDLLERHEQFCRPKPFEHDPDSGDGEGVAQQRKVEDRQFATLFNFALQVSLESCVLAVRMA